MCRFQDLFNVAEQPLKVNYLNKRVLQQWNPIVSSKRIILLSRDQDQGSGSLEHNLVYIKTSCLKLGVYFKSKIGRPILMRTENCPNNHRSFIIALLNDESKNPEAIYNTLISDLYMKSS